MRGHGAGTIAAVSVVELMELGVVDPSASLQGSIGHTPVAAGMRSAECSPAYPCDDGQAMLTSPGPRSEHRSVVAQVVGETQWGEAHLHSNTAKVITHATIGRPIATTRVTVIGMQQRLLGT